MGYLSLACAVGAIIAVAVPGWGKFAAVGLGLFAAATGFVGYRQRGSAARRLAGATGVTLGLAALLLGGLKVTLTFVAIDRLEKLLSP